MECPMKMNSFCRVHFFLCKFVEKRNFVLHLSINGPGQRLGWWMYTYRGIASTTIVILFDVYLLGINRVPGIRGTADSISRTQ